MKNNQSTILPNSLKFSTKAKSIAQLLAIGTIATGTLSVMSATPSDAAVIGNGQLAFSDGTLDFFGAVNPVAGNTFSVTFDPSPAFARVNSATGDFAPFFTLPPSQNYSLASSTGNFSYVSGTTYRLTNNLPFAFTNGISIGVNAGSLFELDFNDTFRGVSLTAINAAGTITNPDGTVATQQLAFSFNDLPVAGGGNYAILVSPTAVPEPFTIIGTLVGGTAALRLRKKLTGAAKN